MFGLLLRRNLARYLVLAIAAPLVGRLLVRRAESMRTAAGSSTAADRLERVGTLLQRGRRRRRRRLGRLRRS